MPNLKPVLEYNNLWHIYFQIPCPYSELTNGYIIHYNSISYTYGIYLIGASRWQNHGAFGFLSVAMCDAHSTMARVERTHCGFAFFSTHPKNIQKYKKSVRIMNKLRMTSMWNHQLWMVIADPQAVAQTEMCWLCMTKSSLTTRGPDSWVCWRHYEWMNETCTCINTMSVWVCFDYLSKYIQPAGKFIPPVFFPVLVAVNGPFHLSATAATLKQSFWGLCKTSWLKLGSMNYII